MNTETKYKQKCRDLRKRIREIEEHNELVGVSITRTKRDIKRLRLERSLLLEKLEERTSLKVDDSDGTPSPPSSPVLHPAGSEVAIKKSAGESGTSATEEHGSPSPAARKVVAKKPVNGRESEGLADGDDEEHTEGPSTPVPHKKRPPPRDPNLPKRPQNAYIIFCEMQKEAVKKQIEQAHPGAPFDLTKAMAEKWHDLPDLERAQYYSIYEADKERYAREMVACHIPNPSPSEQKEKQRAEKSLRDIEKKKIAGARPSASSSQLSTVSAVSDGIIKKEEPTEPPAEVPPQYNESTAGDVQMQNT